MPTQEANMKDSRQCKKRTRIQDSNIRVKHEREVPKQEANMRLRSQIDVRDKHEREMSKQEEEKSLRSQYKSQA